MTDTTNQKALAKALKEYANVNKRELTDLSESVSQVAIDDIESMLESMLDEWMYEAADQVMQTISDDIHDLYAGHVSADMIHNDLIQELGDLMADHVSQRVRVSFNIECPPFNIIRDFFELDQHSIDSTSSAL